MPQSSTPDPRHKAVGLWLLAIVAMVFVMIVLGGLTRLTHSGLSMVEWQLTTVLPPMTDVEWQEMFDKYKQFPQFIHLNSDMDLDGFKGIFWLEFIHRNWGRSIGVAFLLPLLWFAYTRRIDRPMAIRLGGLFLLGAAQGAMGWIMVASGLVDRPDVSQYKLTLHLAFAVVIIGLLLWMALSALRPLFTPEDPAVARRLNRSLKALLGLIFLTILSGGFVAGLDAALIYNTFPLMDGAIVPGGLYPDALAPFEDIKTVQFDHRVLAISTLVLTIALWVARRDDAPTPTARTAFLAMAAMAVVQVTLGVSTLLLAGSGELPVHLAATHQAGAVVLFLLTLWTIFETRPT